MRIADDRHIVDLVIAHQEVLDLDRIEVLTAGDDNVLLTVDQEDEAVLIQSGHIAGMEPAVDDGLGGRFRVLIILQHDAGSLDTEFTDFTIRDRYILLIHDLGLPAISGNADGADLVDILHTQMDTAGAGGFRQAVVGVVFMMREVFEPAADQAGRNRLGTDMHQAPLAELVILHFEFSGIQGCQDILGPGHQQPYDRAAFIGDRAEDGLG